MRRSAWRSSRVHVVTAGLLFLLVTAPGCSSLSARQFVKKSSRPDEARDFFRRLDQTVQKYGVLDAGDVPVNRFPYLRTNRFLTAMKNQVTTPEGNEWLIQQLHLRDLAARVREIQNLPDEALPDLGAPATPEGRAAVLSKMAEQSAAMRAQDQQNSAYYETVKGMLSTRSSYSLTMRIAGLYPLFAGPVALATSRAHQEFQSWFERPITAVRTKGTRIAYRPPEAATDLSVTETTQLYARLPRNPVGLPVMTDAQEELIARAFAPVIYQDVAADYDRIGTVTWKGDTVTIDVDAPAVYYYFTNAFLKGRPVVQINYTVWYPGRLGPDAPRLERGELDGWTARVTLDSDGQVAMIDVTNNCGCYHFYVPAKDRVTQVKPQALAFDPLVVAWLPDDFPRNRLNYFVKTGWHQVDFLSTALPEAVPASKSYVLRKYAELESLPHRDGRRESVFNTKGIMKDSCRIEPYLFFSMGIPKVGFMRQRGHHAITLTGHTHFTEPDLLDRNFGFR